MYADDLAMWHTTKHTGISARRLNEDLDALGQYCTTWKLKINTQKTVYAVFTKSHKVAQRKLRLELQGVQLTKDECPTYLGIQLDRQLTLGKHVRDLKTRAHRRLLLLKRLAGSSWGADKKTLRQLYTGYVRSLMEYNLALQSICSKTTLASLDKVQNEAVHFIPGGMRSKPTAASEINTNMGLRRDTAVVNMVERFKRADGKHPNRQIVDDWKQVDRLQQKNPS